MKVLRATLELKKAPLRGRFLFLRGVYGLSLASLLLAYLAPNHYPPWSSFHGEACAFFAVVAAFFGCAWIARREDAGFLPYVGVLIAISVWIAFQYGIGLIVYAGDVVVVCLYVFTTYAAFCTGCSHGKNRQTVDCALHALSLVLVVAAVLSTLLAILQWNRLEDLLGIFAMSRTPDMRPFGNLAQPNHLALLLSIALLLCVYLYDTRKFSLGFCACMGGLICIGIVASESRACLGSMLTLVAVMFAFQARTSARLSRWLMLGFLGTILLVSAAWPHINSELLLQPAREQSAFQDDSRRVLWQQAAVAIAQSPILGYGWRQGGIAQKQAARYVPGDLQSDYTHNVVLDLLVWNGVVVGGVLVIGFAIWWLRRILERRGAGSYYALLAVVPVFVQSLFEFPYAYAYFIFPAGYLMGLAEGVRSVARPALPATLWSFRVFSIALPIVAAYVAYEYLIIEEDFRVLRFEAMNVGRRPDDYALPDLIALTHYKAVLVVGRMQPTSKMDGRSIEEIQRLTRRFAWLPFEFKLIVSLVANNRAPEARAELSTLRSLMSPNEYSDFERRVKSTIEEKFPEYSNVWLRN
jgi:O-antigen ligase